MAVDSRSLQLRREVRRWLAAEAAGREETAEGAFQRVLRSLPSPPVPAGFAVAVLRRAGMSLPTRSFFARRWVRWLVVTAFLGLGSLAALLPEVLLKAGGALSPSHLAEATRGVVSLFGEAIAGTVALVPKLFEIAGLAIGVANSPGFAGLLATLTLLTLGALRLVGELTQDQGGHRHAEPI